MAYKWLYPLYQQTKKTILEAFLMDPKGHVYGFLRTCYIIAIVTFSEGVMNRRIWSL